MTSTLIRDAQSPAAGAVSASAVETEFRFPDVATPDVSIVVPTYQGARPVIQALSALLEHTEPCYEVIVVDNASTDTTRAVLDRTENATIVYNERNEGFGPASNQGAALARGPYLLFLNQDVFVRPGWLGPLVERIESDERIGAVGPMLLNTDGSLQCAGASVCRSGATESYGEGDYPDHPQYRSPRVVDYLPGACLLVRRGSFEKVGGFDPIYGLAYFEDTDLCMALADHGYLSVYEPGSVVTHLRGRPGEQLLRLAERNRILFADRWRCALASQAASSSGSGVSVATRRRELLVDSVVT